MTPTPRAHLRLITALALSLAGLLAACDRKDAGPSSATPSATVVTPPATAPAAAAPAAPAPAEAAPPANPGPAQLRGKVLIAINQQYKLLNDLHSADDVVHTPLGLYLELPRGHGQALTEDVITPTPLSQVLPQMDAEMRPVFSLVLPKPPEDALVPVGAARPLASTAYCRMTESYVTEPGALHTLGRLGMAFQSDEANATPEMTPDQRFKATTDFLDMGEAPVKTTEGAGTAALAFTTTLIHSLMYVDRDTTVRFAERCEGPKGNTSTDELLELKAGWNLIETRDHDGQRADGFTVWDLRKRVVPLSTEVAVLGAH